MCQSPPSLFHGRHFDHSIIILCVRWSITEKLSDHDLVQLMTARGVVVAQTTILSWVQCQVPVFEQHRSHDARPVGTSWRGDETSIRVRGRWTDLARAVDKQGLTVDFLLREHRDLTAAKRFFTRAPKQPGAPPSSTLDGSPALHSALTERQASGVFSPPTKVWTSTYWTSTYLNNLGAQAQRRVKQRLSPLLGCKNFAHPVITISGIERAQKIKTGQFKTSRIMIGTGVTIAAIWEQVRGAEAQGHKTGVPP